MGKKARSATGIQKAQGRKVDKSALPPPLPPPSEELGSAKILDEPCLEGRIYKVLGGQGYDDGGVADLALLLDLEDTVQRRKRGDADYQNALKQGLLPRATVGPMAKLSRRDQKVQLAQLLFYEEDALDGTGLAEVYQETASDEGDPQTIARRESDLTNARASLRISLELREHACVSLSLTDICKRVMALKGKAGAEEALRCADKALEIASDGFWDNDEVAIEAEDTPVVNPKYEKNATTPGLAHETSLRLIPLRVSHLCKRSALLQRGNVLTAMGRQEDARACYLESSVLIEKEPRCARVDWERYSLYVNIGNTYSRSGDYDSANEYYKKAEQLGIDHLNDPEGAKTEGQSMVDGAKRNRAFALKKAGREEEGKAILKEVIESQIRLKMEREKQKKEEEEAKAAVEVS